MDNLDLDDFLTEEEKIKFNITRVPYTSPDEANEEKQYTLDLITYYLMGIGGITICLLGLIGNILSLIVLSRKSMRSSTYSYLSALSFCDSLVLIFTGILLVKDLDKPVKGEIYSGDGMHTYLFRYIHPLAFTFQVISIWLTLSFTVDRYIMICHPFTAEPYCSISRARKVIIGIVIVGVLFNIPKFFEYKTVTVAGVGDISYVANDLTDLGKNQIFQQLYHSGFYIAFVCGVPFLTLAVLNAFLMHAVRLSRQRGREINAADKKRNDTTVMLIGVVVVFFICQMPALVSRTLWAVLDNQKFEELPLYTFSEISNFLIVINSAINIVPYYFFGKKFRREFWMMICHCLRNHKRFQNLTRSFSLTQLDNPHSPNSRSHSVVSAHVVKQGGFNNGSLSSNIVTPISGKTVDTNKTSKLCDLPPPAYQDITKHNQCTPRSNMDTEQDQVRFKSNGHHHVQCPLLEDKTKKKCFCDNDSEGNSFS